MSGPEYRFLLFVLLAFLAGSAGAERADRDKPIHLEADRVEVDDLAKVSTYQGNVRLVQGTLLFTADKLVVRQDAAGFFTGSASGNPAYFRQKREGVDEYIEGWANRIEYDGQQEKVELFGNARVRRGQDEVRGSYIAYDMKKEFYQVKGGPDAASDTNPKGRVRAVIQPKPKTTESPATPAERLRLTPAGER